MTKKVKDIKYPHLEYVSQDVILKIYDKRGKVNFDFHHDPSVEGSAREDFKVTPLKVSPESGNVFELFKGLYEVSSEGFIKSSNPIRDGRNCLRIMPDENGSFDVAVARDLEFTRNASNFTQVELEDQKYKDVFTEIMRPKRVIENVQEMEETLEPIELFGTQLVKKAS